MPIAPHIHRLGRLFPVFLFVLGLGAAPVRAQDEPPAADSGISDDAAPTATATEESTVPTIVVPVSVPSPAAAVVTPPTAEQIAGAAQPSVVRIVTDATLGSGVMIAGGVLTSAHVVKDTAQIEVYSTDHRHAHATVLRIDPTADIALLKTDLSLPALDLEPVAGQHAGDTVVALGYGSDATDPGPASVAAGQLSSTGTGIQGRSLLETTATLAPGYSGGPLLNSRGHVIGLNTFVASVEGGLKLNFFVGSDTAYAFLALAQEKVAPRAIALYTRDPRSASLPYAYLGTGWVLETEDTSHVGQGSYWSRFHLDTPDGNGRITVQAGVQVVTSSAAAAFALPQVVPTDEQFTYVGSPKIGDDAGAWLSKSGRTAVIAARVANVIVLVSETRASPLRQENIIGAGSLSDMVHYMCDLVVSQVT
jgi:S1-C subfamily serine protease